MKFSNTFLLLLVLFIISNATLSGQQTFTAKDNIKFKVEGTSTLHNWEMNSTTGDCSAVFTLDENGAIVGLSSMTLSVPVKALKSDKDGMDKNAYKSLKSDKNPNIKASLKSATIVKKDASTYTINAKINLTLAGKTLETPLVATAKVSGNNITVSGEKNIDMKTFDMEPPTFMLGAVKTGKDVVLKFDVTLKK